MTTEILPCAWCLKKPHKEKLYDVFSCKNPQCGFGRLGECFTIDTWNDLQRLTMEMRKKDHLSGGQDYACFMEDLDVTFNRYIDRLKAEAKHGEEEKS